MRHLVLLALAAAVCALDIGDPAPSLKGVTWVKGAAVETGGAVTVVEFWATWCGPCKVSIPHLTKLQHEHGDKLRVVGISNEDRATVEPFVTQMGEQMAYHVGIAAETDYGRWMEGRDSIPTAFVVDKTGTVAWVGHPMSMEEPLKQVIAGTYDLATAKRLVGMHSKLEEQIKGQRPDIKAALATIDAILAVDPVDQQAVDIGLAIARYTKDAALLRRTLERLPVDKLPPGMANGLAWDLAIDQELTRRNLDLAQRFIAHAIAAMPDDAAFLDTQARVRYALGQIDEAIAIERKAVAAAPEDENAKQVLAYYESLPGLRAGKPAVQPAAPAPMP